MKKIAIVGLGKWGKNLVREFSNISDVVICFSKGNKTNVKWLQKNYPHIKHTKDFDKIIKNKNINAVVIATPIKTHYQLTKQALESDKHVFVEKPITNKISDAEKLIQIAKTKNLKLFVGHIFLYHQIFEQLKKILKNELLVFAKFDSMRLGTFDEDIFLNLLIHDISIISELFGTPKKINLRNSFGFITKADTIFVDIELNKKQTCIINIDRNSFYKKKIVTIVTSKNSYIWNDDKLLKFNKKTLSYSLIFKSTKMPLTIECELFISDINKKKISIKNAEKALEFLKIITKLR